MKALSLKQPWAELILQGKKTIETRKWRTSFRGEFLIHASRQVDSKQMIELGFDDLPTGCIVGKAKLVEVKEYPTKEALDADVNQHLLRLENLDKKRYGFLLSNVKRVQPKQVRGQLNFFEVEWQD